MESSFRQNLNNPNDMRKLSAILGVVGCCGFVFCFIAHSCIGGHMQHGPYPVWQYVLDFIWLTSYLLAGVLAMRSNITCRKSYSTVILLLCLSRVLGSIVGDLALAAVIFIVINSIVGFSRPAFNKKSKKDSV